METVGSSTHWSVYTRPYLSRPRRRCYAGSRLDTKVLILAFILIISVTWLNLNKINLSLLLWCYYIEVKCLSLFVWVVDKIWVHVMWQGGIWTSRLFHIEEFLLSFVREINDQLWEWCVLVAGCTWHYEVGYCCCEFTCPSWGGEYGDKKDSLCEEVKDLKFASPCIVIHFK